MNKVGIYFAYWERDWNADFAAYVPKVKRLGFDTLEVAAGALPDMSAAQLDRLRAAAADAEIDLTFCIGLPAQYDVSDESAAVRREGIRYLSGLLERIKILGGNLLGGILYAAWPGTAMSYDDKAAKRERSLTSIREIAKMAEDTGIMLALEVVNRFEQSLLNTSAEGVNFARECESPAVKLLLDSFHMNIEEDSFADAIRAAGDYLGHFHMGEPNRRPPRENSRLPWREIAETLKEISYSGRMVMEPFIQPGGQVGQDIKVFRDLSDGADEDKMDAMAAQSAAFVKQLIRG